MHIFAVFFRLLFISYHMIIDRAHNYIMHDDNNNLFLRLEILAIICANWIYVRTVKHTEMYVYTYVSHAYFPHFLSLRDCVW